MKLLEHVLNGKIASFTENRKPYPSDISDEEWAFVALYLILFPLDAGQRKYSLREVFNAVALCFEEIVHLLRVLLRLRVSAP